MEEGSIIQDLKKIYEQYFIVVDGLNCEAKKSEFFF